MKSKVLVLFLFFTMVFCYGLIAEQEQEEEQPLIVEMNIGIGTNAENNQPPTRGGRLPANFRGVPGGRPGERTVHIFEDVQYNIYENSGIFANRMTDEMREQLGLEEGEEWEGPPNITWIHSELEHDDVFINNNRAQIPVRNPNPSRLVGNPPRLANASHDNSSNRRTTGGRTITSQATIRTISHDCTPPDVMVGIREVATGIPAEDLPVEVAGAMRDVVQGNTPADPSDLGAFGGNTSTITIFEYPRNAPFEEKTSAVVTEGPAFGEPSRTLVPASVSCTRDLTLTTRVNGDSPAANAVYVRRNIPFAISGSTADNQDRRASVDVLQFHEDLGEVDGISIVSNRPDGMDRMVRNEDGSFMFRVQNYPREEYADQPEYNLLVRSTDNAGNRVELELPLYIVETRAYYDRGEM